jgi:hypothetical protein
VNGSRFTGKLVNCYVKNCYEAIPLPASYLFPFTYEGVTYDQCTDVGHTELWCDTDLDGSWVNCDGQFCGSKLLPKSDDFQKLP